MQNGFSKEFEAMREKFQKATIDDQQKYGVHFDYYDLCKLLKAIQYSQQGGEFAPSAVEYWTHQEVQGLFDFNATQQNHSRKKAQKVPALKLELVPNINKNPGSMTQKTNRPKSSQKGQMSVKGIKNIRINQKRNLPRKTEPPR